MQVGREMRPNGCCFDFPHTVSSQQLTALGPSGSSLLKVFYFVFGEEKVLIFWNHLHVLKNSPQSSGFIPDISTQADFQRHPGLPSDTARVKDAKLLHGPYTTEGRPILQTHHHPLLPLRPCAQAAISPKVSSPSISFEFTG